jgi:1,4-dihydroxy-2-naphthoyl-CoA hydrolase
MDVDAITFDGVDPSLFDDMPRTSTPFTDLLDLRLTLVSPTRIEAHLHADERLHQNHGLVHGGVYAAVVEQACSIAGLAAAQQDGHTVVGVSNSTEFLRAHREGRLDVVAEPVHVGRRLQLWRARITREDGAIVAEGQLRLFVVDPATLGG